MADSHGTTDYFSDLQGAAPAVDYFSDLQAPVARNRGLLGDLGTALNIGTTVDIPEQALGLGRIINSGFLPARAMEAITPQAFLDARDAVIGKAREVLGGRREKLMGGVSPQQEAANRKTFFGEDATWENLSKNGALGVPKEALDLALQGNLFGEGWGDYRKVLFSAAESAPSSIGAMAPAVGVAKAASRVAYQAAFEKAGGAAAGEAAVLAAKEASKKAAERAAMISGGGLEGAQGAGAQYESARRTVMDMPDEKLAESPTFQAAMATYPTSMSDAEKRKRAREETADKSALVAAAVAGVVDSLFGGLGDRYLGSAVSGGGSVRKSVTQGVKQEAPTEFVQSAGEKLGENLGVRTYADPSQRLMAGVGEEGVGGALSGGLMGGAMGGTVRAVTGPTPVAPSQEIAAAPTTDDAVRAFQREVLAVSPEDNAVAALAAAQEAAPTASVPAANTEVEGLIDEFQATQGAPTAAAPAVEPTTAVPTTAAPAVEPTSELLPLPPLDLNKAQATLKTLREEAAAAGDPSSFDLTRHPTAPGMVAIRKTLSQEAVTARLEAAAKIGQEAATEPDAATAGLEAAAKVGQVEQVRAAEAPQRAAQQALITRSLRNVEERGGVATAEEAALFQEAGMGKPYDRVEATPAAGAPAAPTVKPDSAQRNAANAAAATRLEELQRQETLPLTAEEAVYAQKPFKTLKTEARAGGIRARAEIARRMKLSPAEVRATQLADEESGQFSLPRAVSAESAPAAADLEALTGAPAAAVSPQQQPAAPTGGSAARSPGAAHGAIVQGTSAEAQEVTAALSRRQVEGVTIAADVVDPKTAEGAVGTEEARIAESIAKLFKKRVVWFRATRTGPQGTRASGVGGFVNQRGDTIFLNADAHESAVALVGHELTHQLRRDHPEVYRAMATAVRADLRKAGTEAAVNAKYADLGYSEQQILEEIVADAFGNQAREPVFWSNVFTQVALREGNGKARTLIQKLRDAMVRLIAAFTAQFKGRPGFDNVITDLRAVSAAVETAAAQYITAQTAAPVAQTGELREAKARLKREHPDEVSPRRPTAGKAEENAVESLLQIDAAAIYQNPEGLRQQMSLIQTYPNYREAAGANTPKQKAERFIAQAKSNLIWLYNLVPDEIKERSHLWYDGANRIANRWSEEYGLKTSQIAGVMAALSPQKDWYMNVSLARRVLDTVTKEQNTAWTPAMTVTLERILAKPQYAPIVAAIKGRTLAEVTDTGAFEKAAWVRVFDETNNSRHFNVITPEGGEAGLQRNFPSKEAPEGVPTTAAWGALNSIAKALSIVEDGSLKNIDEQLGNQHKVRSFYNNILVPNSKAGHVTIDTHAVAAAVLRPLSGTSREVAHNFGGNIKGEPGPGSSSIIGYSGTYGLYAEAYRQAAKELGILPRELQSIAWEAVRGLFERENKKGMDFDPIWGDFKKGRASLETTRQRILEAAGGINPPTWFGRDAERNGEVRAADDQADVSGSELPGNGRAAAGGTGSRNPAAVSQSRERILNIGLDVPGGGKLTQDEAIDAVRANGGEITGVAVHQSDTEKTAVITIAAPLTAEQGDAISRALRQEAIVQSDRGRTGELFGPKASKWGDFNPEYFLLPDGTRASEQVKLSAERPDAVSATGYHFSKQERKSFSTDFYGTGAKGAEAARLTPRTEKRLAFYINTGKGIFPEESVGTHAHRAQLSNLYDKDADPKGLFDANRKDQTAFEEAVMDAGYAGYLTRNFSQQGAAVLLGPQMVTPEAYLGIRNHITPEEAGPAMPPPKLSDSQTAIRKFLGNNTYPGGKLTGEEWGRLIRAIDPTVAAALEPTGVFDGTELLYKDELVRASKARLSAERKGPSDAMFEGVESEREVGYKSREKLISMPIRDFLQMAERTVGDEEKATRVKDVIAKGRKFESLPFLLFKTDGAEARVTGHEGRHRAMALQSLGYDSLPVVFRGDIRWSEQSDPKRFDYKETWPITLTGENDTNIPFPVAREDAASPYVTVPPALSAERASNPRFPRRAPAATFANPVTSGMDDIIYKLQDKHVDMKRVFEAIGNVTDKWDAYLQEELYHGRLAKKTADFLTDEVRPFLEDLKARGVEMSDLEEYLWNRHAEERNDQIAAVNPNMPDGGSGIDTADARAYLAALPAATQRKYEALAKRVDAMTKGTRQELVSSGLETQATIDNWDAAYSKYVPLHREDIDHTAGGGAGTGQGYSVRGSATKRAMGSNKPVIDIIANVVMQRERTLTRVEKNRVDMALYGAAIQNPNPDFWAAIRPDEKPAVVQATLTAMGVNPIDAENAALAPVERYVDPRTGLVAERASAAYRNNENVVSARVNGKDLYLVFNVADPRAVRMAQSLKNLDAGRVEGLLGSVAKVTRYFASVNTQYNPIFGMVNFIRDVGSGALNLSSTPLAGHKAAVLKYTWDAMRGIYSDLRAVRQGRTPTSAWAVRWEEFQAEGGQTGYRDSFSNSKERAEGLLDALKNLDKSRRKWIRLGESNPIFAWLSDYNTTAENAVRLAAFQVAKDQGMSAARAASVAKNLTVNFNRKGQVASQVGALYAFFNAAVQGNARIAETLFEFKGDKELKNVRMTAAGKKIVYGGILLGSLQAVALAAAGFGEDDPPPFVRERSLIIPIGDGEYLSWPMPLGFNVITNLGRIPTEFALSGFREPAKRITELMDILFSSFYPLGASGMSMQSIAPTVLDPLVALSENRDWAGKPIAKPDFNSLAPTPGPSRAKDSASFVGRWVSEAINFLTGGDKYSSGIASPTPDQIDYLIGQAAGGVGREGLKVAQTIENLYTGEDLPAHKVPVLGRFYGSSKSQASEGGAFYSNVQKLNEHEYAIKERIKDKLSPAAYIADHPEARLVEYANRTEQQVREYRKLKKQLVERDAPPERVKALENQITRTMARFNQKVREVAEAH